MKKESKDFIRGAEWALRRIENRLPFGLGERRNHCDCSADCVYYIAENRKILERNKWKTKKRSTN